MIELWLIQANAESQPPCGPCCFTSWLLPGGLKRHKREHRYKDMSQLSLEGSTGEWDTRCHQGRVLRAGGHGKKEDLFFIEFPLFLVTFLHASMYCVGG